VRILYHHRTASRDGQAVHIDEMIAAMRGLGHEVLVVAPDAGDGQGMGAKVGWVHSLRNRLPQSVYELMEFAYSFVAYRRLRQAARTFKPDALYERCNLYLIAGAVLSRKLGLPMMLEVNAPLAEERQAFGGLGLPRLARWTERFAWRNADRVLPVTRVLGNMLVEAGVHPDRVVVIPNAINQEHFEHAPPTAAAKEALGWPDALILGFTGFVRDWHGVDRVLHWMASAEAPSHARLLMVGDGPARPALEAQARQLGLTDRVRFTGVVPREQIPDYVSAFDIALQPAVTAYASPLKIFEYLALGKAIIAPSSPNVLEVLDDRNAALFDPAVPGDFERVLSGLARSAERRAALAVEAKATIERRGLTWRANAERVIGEIQAVASGQVGAPSRPVSSTVAPHHD
jgi:glycosyltransferase involved in cell wall biosynthesis